MPISDLINNITGSIRGLGTALGLIDAKSDPNYIVYQDFGINPIDNSVKERWFNFITESYAFSVIKEGDDLSVGSASVIDSITKALGGSSDSKFSDFALPLTPQEITQVEKFATKIKPTLGGTTVNHSGNKYKDLVLSGTTGVHPFKGSGGASRINGQAIFQPDELKYRSGYEVFIHFRNWIKSYVQTKAQGEEYKNYRMLFKNYRDWEFLIVEPLEFTMKRDASRPLLYNYNIKFRVLGHYKLPEVKRNFLDQVDNALNVAKGAIETARGVFSRTQDIIRSTAGEVEGVIENMRLLGLAVKAAQGIPLTASDVSTRIEQNFLSQRDALQLLFKMKQTSNDLANDPSSFERAGVDLAGTPSDPKALANKYSLVGGGASIRDPKLEFAKTKAQLGGAVSTVGVEEYPDAAKSQISLEQQNAALISRIELQNIRESVNDLKDRFADASGLSDDTYNSIFGFISSGDQQPDAENIDSEYEILYGFTQALEGIDALLSTDEMFDVNSAQFSKASSNSGADNIGLGIFSFPDPNAGFREGIVPVGSSLEDIAAVELGDSSRWTEIAELNGLKAPYIDLSNASKVVNYKVRYRGYWNPSDIQDLRISEYYLVAPLPVPSGAWMGKANNLAQYLGSDPTVPTNWRFIVPPLGTVFKDLSSDLFFELTQLGWDEIEPEALKSTEVLRPGDTIKIPTVGGGTPQTFIRGPRDNRFLNELSPSEKGLGVDLRIKEDGDLDLTPSGDLNVAAGAANGAQMVVLKLLYEKGELKKHTDLGTQIKVGGKVPDIATLRTQILNTLLQDERITDVRNVNLRQNNSLLEITFDVYFRTIQTPVPINIPI